MNFAQNVECEWLNILKQRNVSFALVINIFYVKNK